MKREDLEKLWPILEAYRQGKTIEVYNPSTEEWDEKDDPYFDEDPDYYRIVTGPKYRPFKNSEECWEEMKKHEPFGWVKSSSGVLFNVFEIGKSYIVIAQSGVIGYDKAINVFGFADGTPFGKKEE